MFFKFHYTYIHICIYIYFSSSYCIHTNLFHRAAGGPAFRKNSRPCRCSLLQNRRHHQSLVKTPSGWLFLIYGKIRNVPNHQPAMVDVANTNSSGAYSHLIFPCSWGKFWGLPWFTHRLFKVAMESANHHKSSNQIGCIQLQKLLKNLNYYNYHWSSINY